MVYRFPGLDCHYIVGIVAVVKQWQWNQYLLRRAARNADGRTSKYRGEREE